MAQTLSESKPNQFPLGKHFFLSNLFRCSCVFPFAQFWVNSICSLFICYILDSEYPFLLPFSSLFFWSSSRTEFDQSKRQPFSLLTLTSYRWRTNHLCPLPLPTLISYPFASWYMVSGANVERSQSLLLTPLWLPVAVITFSAKQIFLAK